MADSFNSLSATGDTGRQHIIIVRLRHQNRMRYAWTKQAAIYIVYIHTNAYACVCVCVRAILQCLNQAYRASTAVVVSF